MRPGRRDEPRSLTMCVPVTFLLPLGFPIIQKSVRTSATAARLRGERSAPQTEQRGGGSEGGGGGGGGGGGADTSGARGEGGGKLTGSARRRVECSGKRIKAAWWIAGAPITDVRSSISAADQTPAASTVWTRKTTKPLTAVKVFVKQRALFPSINVSYLTS